ncbi:uncharacterized protein MELLADRAFT_86447 [Melampsora larici-populina 98AG31]|uniref:Uncharacterized protein n=1 Tax=Melampsora larici-populina (strain 98AG31 / pathotype 3-4-7) TaxID=747676 RepID=F4RLV3_MELLP|nr:uncharacterized protein MELLADRAFT_86447 [Melampsora larici-populina 98AG31]EGG06606.1 hypothetical protein MELLADRAFT_86447 [Melampsora larici-populina 98AG31]
MVHRRIQNVPLGFLASHRRRQDTTNRPISPTPTGPTRMSPRLLRTNTYRPLISSLAGPTGFGPPGSPRKRNMPYPVPLENSLQLPTRQPAGFMSASECDALEWSHSVSPAQNPFTRLRNASNYAPGPSPIYQAGYDHAGFTSSFTSDGQLALDTAGSPTLLGSSTILGSHSSQTNASTTLTSNTPSGPITLVIDDDHNGVCRDGCTGCNCLPDDTSEDLPLANSILEGLPTRALPLPEGPIAHYDELPLRTFEITFNVYQRKVPATDSVAGRIKKGRGRHLKVAPKPAKPQWSNYKPLVPTYSVLPVGSFSWSDWRTKLFNACNERLQGISDALAAAKRGGTLAIQGFINGTDRKTTKQRVYLTDDVSFGQFVHAILAAPSTATVGIKIVHPHPKNNEDANRSLAKSTNGSGANPPSDPSDELDGSESEGSDALTPAEKKYKLLMARFEKAFKSGENVATAVNTKDTSKVLLLNTARIRTWANDWADGVPGVDEMNPPMARPNFNWVNASDYEDEKAELLGLRDRRPRGSQPQSAGSTSGGTVIHHNYYGQGMPSPGMPVPSAGFHPATPSFD